MQHFQQQLRQRSEIALKGIALVRLEDGTESDAELHWYEAHGIGKQEMKVKELLD